jgi:hypothetical protein
MDRKTDNTKQISFYEELFEKQFREIEFLATQQKKYLSNLEERAAVMSYFITGEEKDEKTTIYVEHTKKLGETMKNYFSLLQTAQLQKEAHMLQEKKKELLTLQKNIKKEAIEEIKEEGIAWDYIIQEQEKTLLQESNKVIKQQEFFLLRNSYVLKTMELVIDTPLMNFYLYDTITHNIKQYDKDSPLAKG